jgi:RHS repeat-associated protein
VTERFVSTDGSSSTEKQWSYSQGTSQSGIGTPFTITDPLGASQTTYFNNIICAPMPSQVDWRDSGGKLVQQVLNTVVYDSSAYSDPAPSPLTGQCDNPRITISAKVLSDTNQKSQTTFTYGAFGNITDQYEYDWGNGGIGSLLRHTSYQFQHNSNSAYGDLSAHILDRVTNKSICDGGGTFCSQTATSYDTTTIASTAANAVIQHDYTNHSYTSTVRGNPTVVSQFISSTAGNAVTTSYYNDVGNLIKVTDPNNNDTAFGYADNFANGVPAQPSSAYVTQITLPSTNGVNHIQRSQYYLNTGLLAATCGENFAVGSSCVVGLTGTQSDYQSFTFDSMNRPLTAKKGDGGETDFTYNEASLPISIGTSTKIDNTPHYLTQSTVYDGLGRKSQTQLTSDPSGTVYQLTTYDALGRKSQVFNPTRCNPPATNCGESTWGYTTFTYDALGRVIQTTSQDNGPVTTKFTGNAELVTDQAGKQRQSVVDGLGRLVEVDEPGTQSLPLPAYAKMQTDGNFVLYNSANTAMWSTGTNTGVIILMQDDGNLILFHELWQAGTYRAPSGATVPYDSCRIGRQLLSGQILHENQCLESNSGMTFAVMVNGELQMYDRQLGQITWTSGTYGHPGGYATITNGNFAVYDAGGTLRWSSGTSTATMAELEDDGRLIVYSAPWSSGTSQSGVSGSLVHPACDVGPGTGWTGVLGAGSCFVSPNGHFELLMQPDGNLVINDLSETPSNTLWSTNTPITPISPGYASVTKYTYDGLSNLTCVEQHGGDSSGTGCSAPPSSDANSTWRVRRFTYDSLSRLTSSSNPEANSAVSGTSFTRVNTTYTYDANSNSLQKTSPAPNQSSAATQTISYCYDALNRVTGKAYSAQTCTNGRLPQGTAVASYFYDEAAAFGLTISNGTGRRTSMSDQGGTEAWSYDPVGRNAAEKRTTAGVSKTTSYLYNLLGVPTSITYPSTHTVAYTYNNAGRAITAADSGVNYVTSATYAPAGALSRLANGTNLTSAFYYNNRLQPCRSFVTTGTGIPANCADSGVTGNIMDFTYGFNLSTGDNGNIISIANNRDSARTQTFTYDLLNRISTAQTNSTSGTKCFGESFGYDAWGNLLSIGGVSGYSGCTQENPALGGVNVANRLATINYDAAGNMLIAGYTYDAENHLLTAGGVAYTYDGDGKRVQKSSGKVYWYGMGSDALDETDATGATNNSAFNEYIFLEEKRIARRDSSNSVFYYFADHLRTSRVMVQSGQTAPCYDSDFYPFGGERTPIANSCTPIYKFTGKERDFESSLDDFGPRYYSSALGRFGTPDDPFANQSEANPQSWNLYSYALNNPSTFVDIDGRHVLVCLNLEDGSQRCQLVSDGTYDNAQKNETDSEIKSPKLGQDGNITCGGVVCGEVQYIPGRADEDGIEPGTLGPGDIVLFGWGRGLLALGERESVGAVAEGAGKGAARGGGRGLLTATEGVLLSHGTKAAAKAIVEALAEGAQKASLRRAIQAATNQSLITIQELADGSVRVFINRAGVDGGQTIIKTVAVDGASKTVQVAVDGSGNLVHYDPKN